MLTHTRHQKAFKNAIFKICGSRSPTLACLSDISRRAAKIARRSRPWKARTLYVCLHLERYEHHNNGAVKYGISQQLYDAVMRLAGSPGAMNGKRPVRVYARGVREGAVILGRSHKCAWRKCRIHFVSDSRRKYCSDGCGRLAHANQRRRAAKEHRERARQMAVRKRREKRR